MDYFKQTYQPVFTDTCKAHLYTDVFLLPPWKQIYKTDCGRFESFDDVLQIHEHLKNTYKSLGYNITEVPFGTVEERTNFILNTI